MSYDNPAAIVTSAAGNMVGVINDGTNYRLAVDTRNSAGVSPSQPAQGSASVAKTIGAQLASGTTTDLQVNGATTSVVFTYPAQATNVTIYSIRLVMSVATCAFNGASFGGSSVGALGAVTYAPALTKGILIGAKSGGVNYTLAKYAVNEDFLCGNGGGNLASSGGTTLLWSICVCNQLLVGGSTDAITATVQDNVTNRNINVLRAYAVGISA